MKKIGTFLLIMGTSVAVNAGFNGLTIHSRANCINNESISWDYTANSWYWTNSDHYSLNTGEFIHGIWTLWEYTWRSAALYLVNKKPSASTILGNSHTGFIYSLNWYSPGAMNQFDCANMKFDKQIMTKMIAIANKIDER